MHLSALTSPDAPNMVTFADNDYRDFGIDSEFVARLCEMVEEGGDEVCVIATHFSREATLIKQIRVR